MDPQSVAPEEGGGTLNDGTISEADELRKLADLKQQGFLTDEEFSTAKAKLLDLAQPAVVQGTILETAAPVEAQQQASSAPWPFAAQPASSAAPGAAAMARGAMVQLPGGCTMARGGLISPGDLQGIWVGCVLGLPWCGGLRAVDADTCFGRRRPLAARRGDPRLARYARDFQCCFPVIPLCGREYRRAPGSNCFVWTGHPETDPEAGHSTRFTPAGPVKAPEAMVAGQGAGEAMVAELSSA